jgi:hypothetical protein
MKVCCLVKYPPIQGGVSMHSYWMARRLAQRGHQVYVVTNAAEVEGDYRMAMTPGVLRCRWLCEGAKRSAP